MWRAETTVIYPSMCMLTFKTKPILYLEKKKGMGSLKSPTKYPWEQGGCSGLDPFKILTKVGDPRYEQVPILQHI